MLWFLLPTLAHAQQDASLCRGGFSEQDLAVRLQSAETALLTAEVEVARKLVEKTRLQLGCLERVIDGVALAGLGYQLAVLAYQDQDETAALRWARMARQAHPQGDWPSYVPEGHPLRDLVQDEGPPSPTAAPGRVVPPKGGGLFVDGALAEEISGYSEVPAFLQVADLTGRVIESAWIEADRFPPEYVGPPGPPPKAPRWWTDEGFDASRTRRAPEDRAPVLPIAATTGLAVLSGTLYALSALSVSGLEDAATEADLASARTKANTLWVGSLATAAGAVGAGVTVVLASDPGGALPRGGGVGLRLRF